MSRKHFRMVAEAILAQRMKPGHKLYGTFVHRVSEEKLDRVARSLADGFAATNSRFNRARFLDACGVAA